MSWRPEKGGQWIQQTGGGVNRQVSPGLILTHMRNSGSTDSLVMGLAVNAIVATGAKPKNNLIFLATSGRVENAMNPGK